MTKEAARPAALWRRLAVTLALATLATMGIAGSANPTTALAGSLSTFLLFAALFVVLHRYRESLESQERGVMWMTLVPTAIFLALSFQRWKSR